MSFITVLDDIFNARKRNFDKKLKSLLTSPEPHVSVVLVDKPRKRVQSTLEKYPAFDVHIKRFGKIRDARLELETQSEYDEFETLLGHFKAIKMVHLHAV
jgi:hypothetical protein